MSTPGSIPVSVELARAKAGAPEVDGETFAAIERKGVEAWLSGLRKELTEKSYRPAPVRRVMIPKPGGGERPLGMARLHRIVVRAAIDMSPRCRLIAS